MWAGIRVCAPGLNTDRQFDGQVPITNYVCIEVDVGATARCCVLALNYDPLAFCSFQHSSANPRFLPRYLNMVRIFES